MREDVIEKCRVLRHRGGGHTADTNPPVCLGDEQDGYANSLSVTGKSERGGS